MTIISRETLHDASVQKAWSRKQPVFHVVVLGCLTLSAYVLFWLYKTLRMLKTDAKDAVLLEKHKALSMFSSVSPLLRTVAVLSPAMIAAVPFVAGIIKLALSDAILIYVFATLFVGAALLEPDEHTLTRQHPLIACGLVLGTALLLASLSKLQGPLYLLSLPAAVLPCAFIQHWLNRYLSAVEPPDLPVRTMFNGLEMVCLVAGAILLGLVAAGMMMGIAH